MIFNPKTLLVIAALSAAFFVSCRESDVSPGETSTQPLIEETKLDPLDPIKSSNNTNDLAKCEKIRKTIKQRNAEHEKWSVFAVDLSSGNAVCSINARALLKAASVQKTITTAAALDKLGKDFSPRTSIHIPNNQKPSPDKIVLYGRGATDLDSAKLKQLAESVKKAGVTEIQSDVIGDDSYFRGDPYGDGWTWNELQWYYGAPVSALSFEDNFFRLKIVGGKAEAPDGIKINTKLVPAGDLEAIGVRRIPGSNTLYVWGEGKSLNSRLAVTDPALLAAKAFKENLELIGVKVSGDAVSKDWTTSSGIEDLTEIASVAGRPLIDAVQETNQDSVNLYPELMLRELGKRFGGEAPDPNPKLNRLRGDDIAGAAFLKKWLKEKTGRGDRLSIHDGSGLSAYNLLTTESLVRNLIFVTKSDFREAFAASLSVSGVSGTYKNRLTDLRGKVLAKTGTVKHVNSLAGYIYTSDQKIAFAVVVNGETTRKDSNTTVDTIVRSLAE